jgi:hypothetical protein
MRIVNFPIAHSAFFLKKVVVLESMFSTIAPTKALSNTSLLKDI